MREIYFRTEAMQEMIASLKQKKRILENILDEYQHLVVSHIDKMEDFAEKIKWIREALRYTEQKLEDLYRKAEKVLAVYERVEEENLRLVEELPKAEKIWNDPAAPVSRANANVNVNYNVLHDEGRYIANSNYDFDDWLISWLRLNMDMRR